MESNAKYKVGECLRELDLKGKGLIVSDSTTRVIAGKFCEQNLKKIGYKIHNTIIENPEEKDINHVTHAIHRHNADFIIAIGGTSIIDVVKSAAFASTKSLRKVPYIAFTTTAANDGFASSTASIFEFKKGRKIKVSRFTFPPIAVIADLDIISNTRQNEKTKWMIPAGFGEIIAKITSLKDWQLENEEKGEYYCDYIANLIQKSLKDELNSIEEIIEGSKKGLEEHVYSLINTGMAMILAGSSRPCSGSEHLFCHALDSIKQDRGEDPGRHGEQVAVGTPLMAKYHVAFNADNWWREEKYQPEYICNYLRRMSCPSKINEINVDKKTAVHALINAKNIRLDRYTILHKWPLDRKLALTLLSEEDDLNL